MPNNRVIYRTNQKYNSKCCITYRFSCFFFFQYTHVYTWRENYFDQKSPLILFFSVFIFHRLSSFFIANQSKYRNATFFVFWVFWIILVWACGTFHLLVFGELRWINPRLKIMERLEEIAEIQDTLFWDRN